MCKKDERTIQKFCNSSICQILLIFLGLGCLTISLVFIGIYIKDNAQFHVVLYSGIIGAIGAVILILISSYLLHKIMISDNRELKKCEDSNMIKQLCIKHGLYKEATEVAGSEKAKEGSFDLKVTETTEGIDPEKAKERSFDMKVESND